MRPTRHCVEWHGDLVHRPVGGPGRGAVDSSVPNMPESLHDRWTNLVEAIRGECGDHGQHPDLLEVDETTLNARLPIHADTWHSECFCPEAILRDNPAEMAARFFERYHKAREAGGQAPA
jgi:hypothetical protein